MFGLKRRKKTCMQTANRTLSDLRRECRWYVEFLKSRIFYFVPFFISALLFLSFSLFSSSFSFSSSSSFSSFFFCFFPFSFYFLVDIHNLLYPFVLIFHIPLNTLRLFDHERSRNTYHMSTGYRVRWKS